jgi:hypothetical protein
MADFNHYRIYCETEVAWVDVWADTPPTTCPNNVAHTVRAGSAAQFETKLIPLVPKGGQGLVGIDVGVADESLRVAGSQVSTGSLTVGQLATPSAPTVQQQGTPGSTTWGYKVSALDEQGETLASSETQITDGAATLNATDYNAISWSAVTGAASYKVYRSTAGGTPATTGEIGETQDLSLDDTGLSASGSEPTANTTGQEDQSADATATGDTTTTSATDVLVDSMSITPVAGIYLVRFSGSVDASNNYSNISMSIYAGGSQAAASELTCCAKWTAGDCQAFTCIARVEVNGSQAIEGRWRTDLGTATMHQRTMTIEKVA